MSQPVWIDTDEALIVHDLVLAEHGGREGVRDFGALASALARPRNLLAYSPKSPSLARLAAAYAFAITRSHPFVDGNKRVALVVSLTFLELNGIQITASQEELYLSFLRFAQGHFTEAALSRWLERHSAPLGEC